MFISIYISPTKKVLKFFFFLSSGFQKLNVAHPLRKQKPTSFHLCMDLCGDVKKIYNKNHFARAFVPLRSINPCLSSFPSSLLLRPSISLSLKTAMEVWSLVCHRSCLLLPFMFSTSPQTFSHFSLRISCISFFFLSPSFLKNHPFLSHCSFCEPRQPCNCGLCEERNEHRASIRTYSQSPNSVFVPVPL